MGVGGGDLREGGEQLAHRPGVVGAGQLQPRPPGVLEQRVLTRRAEQAVGGVVAGAEPGQSVAAVVELTADVLGEVGPVGGVRERPGGGDRLRAEQQHDLFSCAGRDGGGELVDEVLRRLAADDLQHGPRRVRAEAGGDRARVVVRPAQRGLRPRAGDLELTDPRHRVDRGRIDIGIGDRPPGRRRGQPHRGQPLVVRVTHPLRVLAYSNQNRSAGIETVRCAHVLA